MSFVKSLSLLISLLNFKPDITIKTEPIDEGTSNEDSKAAIAIKTEQVDEGTSDEDSKTDIAIKTDPVAESSASCADNSYYVPTPAWFFKMVNIDPKKTLTKMKIVNTVDGPRACYSIMGTAKTSDPEILKRIKMLTKEQMEKEHYLVRAFMDGEDINKMLTQAGRTNEIQTPTVRRKMTRKTKEREEMKRKMKEREEIKKRMGKKEIEEKLKKALRKEKPPCFVFKCAYCGDEYNALAILKGHVFGVKTKSSRSMRGSVLKVTCSKRLEEDGLPRSGYDEVCLDIPPPKKKIWAKIVCKDPKLINSKGRFTIPDEIAKEYAEYFKEIQL